MKPRVRRLGPGDEELVRELSVDSARFDGGSPPDHEPLSPAAAVRLLTDDRTHFLVAEEGAEVVGFAFTHELLRRHGPERMVMLYELGVRADRRRAGVGRALLAHLAELCRCSGITRAFVCTDESNPGAMAFYRRCGWVRVREDDVIFELRP